MKKSLFLIVLSFFSFNAAYANIAFYGENSPQICERMAGHWQGSGEITATIITKINCSYRGNAIVTSEDGHLFSMQIDLTKTSGICPDYQYRLEGVCENGLIAIRTNKADLEGVLIEENNQTIAHARGTIKITLLDHDVTATVKRMDLNKK